MEILVPVVVVLIVVVIILVSRKEFVHEAHSEVSEIVEERMDWQQANRMTYGEIEDMKSHMITVLMHDQVEQDEKEKLLQLVNEWAELKKASFEDRRSWVRKPE